MLGIIRHKIISKYYDDLTVYYYIIKKTKKLIVRKYFWPTLKKDVKAYINGNNICLIPKAVKHKPYRDF